uniref:Chimerin 2 n=1 Tax=Homo sapiens TaxID=9606 RepID=A0A994J5D6_HUMAN
MAASSNSSLSGSSVSSDLLPGSKGCPHTQRQPLQL